MKPHRILLFILSVFAILFACWYFFPSGGVKVGSMKFRFPSYEASLHDLENRGTDVDVDSVLAAMRIGELIRRSEDTLGFFKEFLDSSVYRIHLPDGDYSYFDSLFIEADSAALDGRIVRIMHYGDSQLEMDRISSVLREELQERFGGSGPGMVPMMRSISSVSVQQAAYGGVTRYARVADSLSHWTSTHRYGPLTQFVTVYGSGTFTFRKTDSRFAQERAQRISRVSVLLGHNSEGLEMTLKCDTMSVRTAVLDSARDDVSLVSWTLPSDVSKGTLSFSGNAEVYGIMLDGEPGITVDNAAMRGCDGTVFPGIDSTVMRQSFDTCGTRLIILQFGGNAMPAIGTKKAISDYVARVEEQFDYFRQVAPKAQLLFVGPADMCKSYDSYVVTWPLLPELNDSLKVHCLDNGVAYWDTFNVMGGAGSMRQWVNHNPPLGGPDYIHFTTRGANEIGSALARSILVYDDLRRLRNTISEEAVKEYLGR